MAMKLLKNKSDLRTGQKKESFINDNVLNLHRCTLIFTLFDVKPFSIFIFYPDT